MSKGKKWLVITACILAAALIMTLGFQLAFNFVAGPIPLLAVIFLIYGLGRVWTRSPSQEADAGEENG